ncbi:hypothetical protein U2P60_14825 [Brucella sp. H1_1004]|uniref:hypothetical protein n=1 Tax=Brucella sp. H1_1004 TaxID=3110109 RepID=UPI0039B5264F
MTVPVPDQLEYISDANGVTKDFPYPKRFLQKDEVVVALRNVDGIDTPQILGTHYTIAGSSWPNGGTVSFINAPQAPNKVVRYRMTQAKQTVGLANNQRNDAPSVELQLDRLTMAIQDRGALTEAAWWGLLAEIAARVQGDKLLNARVDKEVIDRENGDDALASLIAQAGPIEVPVYDTRLAVTFATIKATINSIRTAGYAAAGDGGDALYKRVASEPSHAGKVQSADGAWWEIAEKVISFDHFGIDKSGTTVADQGIKDCFDCAYAIGAKVAQNSGTYLWRHQQIDVLVDADLRGATILLDDESGVKPSTWAVETVFLIKNNVEKFDLSPVELADLNDNYRSGMRANSYQLNHPVLANHRDAYVQFYTDTVDILRGDGTDRKIFDHVITGAAGMLTVGFDRSFNNAPVTRCVVYPRELQRRYFYLPLFEAYNPGSLRCVRAERSNTYVGKFEWVEKDGPSEYMVRSLVEASDCVNVLFDGGSSEGQRMGGAAYTIGGGRCIGVTWRDYDAFDGWGTVGTNEIKDTQWIDCGLSRIDAHWGARGSNRAIRCTMKQGASTIGGSGKFSMVDCTYIIGPAASTADNATGAMLAARADYGNEFFGLFEVIRPRIVIAREVSETVFTRIAVVRAGGLVTHDPGRDVSLPNVTVEDPMIVGSDVHGLSTNGLVIVACDLTDARFSVGNRKMIFPSSIRLTGGSFHGFTSNARVTLEAVKCNTHALSSTTARYPRSLPASSNCEIIIDGVNQLVPDNVSPKTNSSPHLLDFKLSISNWSQEYVDSGPNIWFPRIVISNSLKCSLLVPLKAFISVVNSEIIMLDDDYGGRANTPVSIVGGTIRPYIDTPTSENEYMRANTFMSGVTMYISRKPNGDPGVTNLYGAKGAGNFVIDGGHVSPNAHYYGWDANCLNFWAL